LEVLDPEHLRPDGSRARATFENDGFDRLVASVYPLSNRTVLTYDPASAVVREEVYGHPVNEPGLPAVLLRERHLLRDELSRVYEARDRLFLAAGFTTARPPDLRDQDQDGFVRALFEWDALSRPTFLVEDDGEVTQTIWDGASRPLATIDPLGNRREWVYDASSNPILLRSIEVSPEGLTPSETYTTHYVFDPLDRLIRATDNAGQTSRFQYDSRDQLVSRSDPVGPPTADPLGLFPGAINAPGNTKSFIHDGLGRVTAEIADLRLGGDGAGAIDTSNPHNPDGQIRLGYTYDRNSRLTAIIDDANNATVFGYDPLDRQTLKRNADLTEHVFTYDRNDNLKTSLDPNGSLATRTYDHLNRLTQVDVARGTGVVGTTLETYAYDGLSRLTRATDDNGGGTPEVVERVYDSLSRPIEERQNGLAVSSVFAGDGKRLALTYVGGRRLDFTHDAIDRLREIRDGTSVLADHRWIGPGHRPLRRTHANGTTLDLVGGYDAVQRLTRLKHLAPGGGTALVDREYGYDRAGNRTFERRLDQGNLTDQYRYDSAYRLIETLYDQAGIPEAPRRDKAEARVTFDGVGNRRTVDLVSLATGASSQTYVPNAVNEYTSVAAVARVHDENGNLKTNGDLALAYDYRKRVVSVKRQATDALIAEYRYDAFNRRLEKAVFDEAPPGALQKRTRFAYDGWRAVEELSATGVTEVSYVYATGLDELVQMQKTAAAPGGAGTFTYHQNARGDVVALSDAAGAVVERTVFEDFGRPDHESIVGNPYLFQGMRFDPETGFYYFRNRYYDPRTGRFLQRDSVWDPANVGNQYAFVGNVPVSRLDPLGLYSDPADPVHVQHLVRLGGLAGAGAWVGGSNVGGAFVAVGATGILVVGTAGVTVVPMAGAIYFNKEGVEALRDADRLASQ
ncbi:MAG: hypothetical protein L0206_24400, partial [Actinobacteria bacterium]|nr:hypothetical protein [Actinomycetota bacterium]